MKKTIALIVSFFFIQGVIHNIGHPVTPAFVRGLGIPDYMFGVFFSAMSLGLMIGGPLWGVLSDRGRKKIYIIFGLFLYTIGQVGFGYSDDSTLMVVFRFISGFGVVSSFTLMTSHIIEISESKNRAKYLAYLGAAVTLGASFGYGIGGFLSTNQWMTQLLRTDDYRRIFLVQGIANLFYILAIYLFFKEGKTNFSKEKHPSMIAGLKEITKIDTSLFIFFLSLTFVTIGSINLSKYIDVYFNELGYNPQELGNFVMATGFVSLFASLVLVPIFAKKKRQLLTISLIHISSAVIVLFVFRSSNFLLVAYTVYMAYIIFRTIYQPLEQNYISSYGKQGKFGGIMGLRQSFVSVGMVTGPLIGGFLYQRKPLFLFDFSAAMFIIGVALLGIVALIEKNKIVEKPAV